ncbi:MAG: acyl-CoA dehydrogenase family protein [Candidatus Heimdallarchaeota archaeon]
MDFQFSEEEELFREAMREFCQKNITPQAKEIDETAKIPPGLIKAMADQGLLGITISEQYGGQGANFIFASIAGEEIARADISVATAVFFLVEASWAILIEKYGTAEAKEEILPKVCRGEWVCGIATTEPGGGSDVAGTKVTARREGDDYVLNGEKAYISGVAESLIMGGGFLTNAYTDPVMGHKGQTFIFFPLKNEVENGRATTSIFEDMGRMGISTGAFAMKEARAPSYYGLEEGMGFYQAMEGYNNARAIIGATCIGSAQTCLEMGLDYIKERKAFGQPLAAFQGLQFQAAEAYADLEAARLIAYKASWMLDRFYEGKARMSDANKAVALSKLRCPMTAFNVINSVMDWFGAYGYTKEAELERGLRGVRSYSIGAEGATNVMRIIIAREMLGKQFWDMVKRV